MPKIAIYAGSFDPMTIGHLRVIEQIAGGYDLVTVLISSDPQQAGSCMFTAEQRAEIVKKSTRHIRNVRTDIQYGGYTIHYAERHGAAAIIHSILSGEEETEGDTFGAFNDRINPDIPTILFNLPDISTAHVSSSFVKQNCYGTLNWPDIADRYVPPAAKQAMLRKQLRDDMLLQFCTTPTIHTDELLSLIEFAYARPYHNLEHIVNMCYELQEFCQVTGKINWHSDAGRALLAAALFHDYCIESDTDEEGIAIGNRAQTKSAETVKRHCNKYVLDSDRSLTVDLISSTSYTQVATSTSSDMEFMVFDAFADADRAILGQPQRIYDKYAAGIRTEYSTVSDKEFRKGRLGFLRREFCRDYIFKTDYFRAKYEDSAQANIQREYDQLMDE